MTAETIMLIKVLSDIIITASTTLAQVGEMSDEEVKANIVIAEKLSDDLLALVK